MRKVIFPFCTPPLRHLPIPPTQAKPCYFLPLNLTSPFSIIKASLSNSPRPLTPTFVKASAYTECSRYNETGDATPGPLLQPESKRREMMSASARTLPHETLLPLAKRKKKGRKKKNPLDWISWKSKPAHLPSQSRKSAWMKRDVVPLMELLLLNYRGFIGRGRWGAALLRSLLARCVSCCWFVGSIRLGFPRSPSRNIEAAHDILRRRRRRGAASAHNTGTLLPLSGRRKHYNGWSCRDAVTPWNAWQSVIQFFQSLLFKYFSKDLIPAFLPFGIFPTWRSSV